MPPRRESSHETPTEAVMGCCRVESVVSVDERGQMVLPKEVRERTNIRPGEKLALISWERDGQLGCLVLIKVESLTGLVSQILGPLLEGTARR